MVLARCYLEKPFAIAIGIVSAVLVISIMLLIGRKGGGKKRTTAHSEAVRIALLTMPAEQRRRFFTEVFRLLGASVTEDGILYLRKKEILYRIEEQLRFRTLTGDDLVAFKSTVDVPLIILTNNYDQSAAQVAAAIHATLLPWQKVYAILDRLHAYPKLSSAPKRTQRWRRFFYSVINPTRTKYYLLTAVVLLVGTIFNPYKIYYLIVGAVCCVLAGLSFADPVGMRDEESFL